MHCRGERALLSSSFVAVFLAISFFKTPIILYKFPYQWFFLSQGNLWTIYFAHPKILRPKTCLLMFASLVALDGFHLLLSTQLSTDLTPEWSGGSIFHSFSHIYAKNHFCCVETFASNALNRRPLLLLIDFEQTRHSHWTQLYLCQMFIQKGDYTAFWYLQLLCNLMQLQFTIGQNEFVKFFSCVCFSG